MPGFESVWQNTVLNIFFIFAGLLNESSKNENQMPFYDRDYGSGRFYRLNADRPA
jgi:hypothetical protein